MKSQLQPGHLLLLILAGWIDRQGLDNRLIDPGEEVGLTTGEVECRERLGGILRYNHRKAA